MGVTMNTFAFYQQKSVLVTGGAGFIGSHLVEALVRAGAHVSVLDNLSTGTLDNLSAVLNHVTFIQGDVTSFSSCMAATQNQQVVFHCAAMTNIKESMERPRNCIKINVQGTANLLEASRIHRLERFIFSSSAAVYGSSNQACTETTPQKPASMYGCSKQLGEQLCAHYCTFFNLRSICLRYFNVYGPRQHPTSPSAGVHTIFNHAFAHNLPISVYGDGHQTRDFISVHDVVEANLLMAQLPCSELNGQAVNIASGTSISLNDILITLKKTHPDYTETITYQPARVGDITHSNAVIKKYVCLRALVT
jgi:UDP-glucose 4-epimerase